MNLQDIKQLAQLMKESGLTMLESITQEQTIRLERKPGISAIADPQQTSPVQQAVYEDSTVQPMDGTVVLSPMVGIFYTSPSPESQPFVQLGDTVKKGDVLCIIEAMKLMNEIQAETDGVIAEINVGNGQVVEFEQPLFKIVKNA